jgi:hypothetical protein
MSNNFANTILAPIAVNLYDFKAADRVFSDEGMTKENFSIKDGYGARYVNWLAKITKIDIISPSYICRPQSGYRYLKLGEKLYIRERYLYALYRFYDQNKFNEVSLDELDTLYKLSKNDESTK